MTVEQFCVCQKSYLFYFFDKIQFNLIFVWNQSNIYTNNSQTPPREAVYINEHWLIDIVILWNWLKYHTCWRLCTTCECIILSFHFIHALCLWILFHRLARMNSQYLWFPSWTGFHLYLASRSMASLQLCNVHSNCNVLCVWSETRFALHHWTIYLSQNFYFNAGACVVNEFYYLSHSLTSFWLVHNF